MSGSSPKTVTDTVLQYTVNDLSPYVTYTVECTSSNGEDSCNSNMDTIRMPSDGEYFKCLRICILYYLLSSDNVYVLVL